MNNLHQIILMLSLLDYLLLIQTTPLLSYLLILLHMDHQLLLMVQLYYKAHIIDVLLFIVSVTSITPTMTSSSVAATSVSSSGLYS